MAKSVSYDRQTIRSLNPAKRFAHLSRLKRAVDIADTLLPVGGALLDFGAGPGKFLSDCQQRRPDCKFYGYDKFKAPDEHRLTYVRATADLASESIDVLTAFEVLEHLIDADVQSFMIEAKRLLKETGSLVVSVPIMYGPITLIKESSNMVCHSRRIEYSASELLRVVAGQRIARPASADRYTTHKGFDFRALRSTLSREFRIEKSVLSPFPRLPWLLNSQIFMIGKAR
jgi:2-polyprenyl-3-methyl-5-hydroxy-6-metoxy-1,4-benzoquinol methylase